jgi:hypothetical protein
VRTYGVFDRIEVSVNVAAEECVPVGLGEKRRRVGNTAKLAPILAISRLVESVYQVKKSLFVQGTGPDVLEVGRTVQSKRAIEEGSVGG